MLTAAVALKPLALQNLCRRPDTDRSRVGTFVAEARTE